MAAEKPADLSRIFILGESAAMGDPEPAFGAGRYLEALLNERFPSQKFEVVNTGITAINSHVILPIARDCAHQQGDLWIIYMGNNEMVGPFGAATVFGPKAPPRWLVRLSLGLERTRLGQLVVGLGRKVKGRARAPAWGGMEMFLGNQLRPDDPRKETVYRNFRGNLDDIVRAGLDSGAKVILNTVAVNLKDCPPFASLFNSNLPPASRAECERLGVEAARCHDQGHYTEAAHLYEQATQLDAKNPAVQFQWGDCLLHLTNLAAAQDHFQQAVDCDALPFRADSRINGIIRETGKQWAGRGLVLVDAATNLDAMPGTDAFYEHVHFTFEGSYRLALAWAQQVQAVLPAAATRGAAAEWAGEDACARRLGLTEWNRSLVLQSVIRRLAEPPLSGQSNNPQRVAALTERVNALHQRMDDAAAARARSEFLTVIERYPDDHYLREGFAEFLQSIGDLGQAAEQWQRVKELLPFDFLAEFQLGRVLALQGRADEAHTALSQALTMNPMLTQGWIELGNVHLGQGKLELALGEFARAQQQRPQDPMALFRMGQTLSKLGRHTEAIERLRQAIQAQPAFWEAHFQLAGELDAANQVTEAATEFQATTRLQPANARAHFNLGVTLAKQAQLDQAQHEFEETLRLEPTNQLARKYLGQVEVLKKRAR
ncbi:conserved hypothetical protein [Verrucomicrobia bacterium]|nr:conserved hypothetical protein [Verrucomicrobiota bacterium]